MASWTSQGATMAEPSSETDGDIAASYRTNAAMPPRYAGLSTAIGKFRRQIWTANPSDVNAQQTLLSGGKSKHRVISLPRRATSSIILPCLCHPRLLVFREPAYQA